MVRETFQSIEPWICAQSRVVLRVLDWFFWLSCQIEWDLDVATIRWFCPSGVDVVLRNILLGCRGILLPMRLEFRITGHILLTGWIVVVEPFEKHCSHAYAINVNSLMQWKFYCVRFLHRVNGKKEPEPS